MNTLNPNQQTRLINLEAKLDARLFGQHYDPATGKMVDDGIDPVAATAAGVGVAGVGVGGVMGHRAIMGKFGQRQLLGGRVMGDDVLGSHSSPAGAARAAAGGTAKLGVLDAYKSAASSVGQRVSNAANAGMRAGKHAASVYAPGGLGSMLVGLRKGLKVGARKLVGMSATTKRLVELSAALPEVKLAA